MGINDKQPSAWDDDWEAEADKIVQVPKAAPPGEIQRPSRTERLEKHAESNRQLWQSADKPETFHYLETQQNVPLQSDFKPALQVLSRKPAPKLASRSDGTPGAPRRTIEEEEDEEEERLRKVSAPTPEELRTKAQREREEKQRKYDEARQRLFGTPVASPGNSTQQDPVPVRANTEFKNVRNKPRSRGSKDGKQDNSQTGPSRTKPPSSKNLLKRPDAGSKKLYDPNDGSSRGSAPSSFKDSATLIPDRGIKVELPTRQPKPPDEHSSGFQAP
ncbi:MAG: hypothetical protein M1814_003658 [Vezdaea aestivalis]|nr:MAG: hypothetical protein M1814_003658 [Vezdaea aestivalis]